MCSLRGASNGAFCAVASRSSVARCAGSVGRALLVASLMTLSWFFVEVATASAHPAPPIPPGAPVGPRPSPGPSPSPGGLRSGAAVPAEPRVRIVYLVPSDRQVKSSYTEGIEKGARHLRGWLHDSIGQGVTPRLSSPVVEVVRTPHTADWYQSHPTSSPQNLWYWDNAITDAFAVTEAVFDDPMNRWVFYLDAPYGCGQITGAALGVALMHGQDLDGIAGGPAVSPCTQQPAPDGLFRWIGGLGHELGHALGRPHPAGCEDSNPSTACPGDTLMYGGYAIYPQTYLLPDDKAALARSPYVEAVPRPGSTPRVRARLYDIDDSAELLVNGVHFLTRGFGANTDWLDVSAWLTAGGTVQLKLRNTGGGYVYGFEVEREGTLIHQEHCGQFNVFGCNNNDGRLGIVVDRIVNVSGGTTPTQVQRLRASVVNGTTIKVEWDYDGPPVTGFRMVRWRQNQWEWGPTVGATARQFDDVGLEPETTYTYTVDTLWSGGAVAGCGSPCVSVQATTPPRPPSQIHNLRAAPASSTSVRIQWDYTGPPVSAFRLVRWTGTAWQHLPDQVPGTARSWAVTGLQPGTRYEYTVDALGPGGEGWGCTQSSCLLAGATTYAPTGNAGVVVTPQPGVGPSGGRALLVTLTARPGCGPLQRVQFGINGRSFDNASVTVTASGGPTSQTQAFTYEPPVETTSVTATVSRVIPSGGATVNPVLLHDGCGMWQTFVGGGPHAFQ